MLRWKVVQHKCCSDRTGAAVYLVFWLIKQNFLKVERPAYRDHHHRSFDLPGRVTFDWPLVIVSLLLGAMAVGRLPGEGHAGGGGPGGNSPHRLPLLRPVIKNYRGTHAPIHVGTTTEEDLESHLDCGRPLAPRAAGAHGKPLPEFRTNSTALTRRALTSGGRRVVHSFSTRFPNLKNRLVALPVFSGYACRTAGRASCSSTTTRHWAQRGRHGGCRQRRRAADGVVAVNN